MIYTVECLVEVTKDTTNQQFVV